MSPFITYVLIAFMAAYGRVGNDSCDKQPLINNRLIYKNMMKL